MSALHRLLDPAVRRIGRFRVVFWLRVLEIPARLLARAVSRRVRREPGLIAFGAPGDRFADNGAHLFLAASGTRGLRCVWITGSRPLVARLREQGHAAELRWSRRGLSTALRAEWYVITAYVADVNRWTHTGARVLNLWHGVPLKTIERDIRTGPVARVFRARRPRSLGALAYADDTRRPDVVLAPSKALAERCFASAFGVPGERCLAAGYPRTDAFFGPPPAAPDPLLVADPDAWRRAADAPFVVGYFPTWRDDDAPFLERSGLRIERLAETVGALGGVLLFKPHHNTLLDAGAAGPALIVLGPGEDLHAWLALCSVLVTDYSSVAFDFLLLDRPVLYFVPDLDHYAAQRGFYFEPERMMPGPLLRTPEALEDALAAAAADPEPDPRAQAVRDLVWDGYRGGASRTLAAYLAGA